MKVAAVVSSGRLGLRDGVKPRPGPGEALLRVDRVGVCGSDLHALPQMPAGTLLGHEFAGTLVAVGPGVTRVAEGDRVCSLPCIGCGVCAACRAETPLLCPEVRLHGIGAEPLLGAFGQYVLVGEQECVPVPPGVDMTRAALAEPLAVGLHIVERAQVAPGQRVAILGAGPIGLAAALWLKARGVRDILVSEPIPARRALAQRLGIPLTVDPYEDDVAAAGRATWGELPHVVIECMGRPGRFDRAAELVARGGRIVLASFLLEPEQFQPMVPYTKGVTVEFVVHYAVRHFREALDAVARGMIDPGAMVTDIISLEALPAMIERLKTPTTQCKVLVAPNG